MGRRLDRGDGRTLLLFCNDADGWMVGAIETSTSATEGDSAGVLDDHNHKVVGRYETIREALDAADSFAEAWLKNWKATRSNKCDCGEISSARPRSVRLMTVGEVVKLREPRARRSRAAKQR
jgi:hypothetical protein